VHATILAAVHPRAVGEVFNVGTSVETSVNKLVELIGAHVSGISVNTLPDRDIDNIRRRCVNIEKIHRMLGWIPKVNVSVGVERTLDWYRANMG
jgi:UDP-glucose 4-epimerase